MPMPIHVKPRRAEQGYTAIEIVIVIVIFSMILFVLAGMFHGGDLSASYLSATATHQGRCRTVLSRMASDLIDSRLISIAVDPDVPRIEFQLPVDWDGDGDVLGTDNDIEWGSNETAGPVLGSTMNFAFEPYGLFVELVDGIDYNRDGDLGDVFRVGRIVKSSTGGFRQPFGDLDVIIPRFEPMGDVDGDGEADPMFQVVDGMIFVNFFAVNDNVDGPPRFENFQTQINLRNPQF